MCYYYYDLKKKLIIITIYLLFKFLRPDIVIQIQNSIVTLELTVCHETNLIPAQQRKIDKYRSLKDNLLPVYAKHDLLQFTVEVSVLGFISNLKPFTFQIAENM